MRYQKFNSSPKVMTAKFAGKCAETNKPFAVGTTILYFPSTHKAYIEGSKEWQSYHESAFDEKVLGYNY